MASTPQFGRRGIRSNLPPAPAPARAQSAPQGPPPPAPPRAPREPGPDILGLFFSFDGRIPRLWYWLGHLGIFVTAEIVAQVAKAAGEAAKTGAGQAGGGPAALGGLLLLLLVLFAVLGAVVWASLAITVKRWHDRGRSWVWLFLGFVPIVGWIWQGIECGFLEGTLGENQFGPSPKGIAGVVYAPA